MGRKGLGEDAVGTVSPSAVMLDDLIGNLGHGLAPDDISALAIS
jgi:hypothetical protein